MKPVYVCGVSKMVTEDH